MHYIALHDWSKSETNLTTFRGVMFENTTTKQPEMVLSTAKRTFEISKLQNYMFNVNETWPKYMPPQRRSFAHK